MFKDSLTSEIKYKGHTAGSNFSLIWSVKNNCLLSLLCSLYWPRLNATDCCCCCCCCYKYNHPHFPTEVSSVKSKEQTAGCKHLLSPLTLTLTLTTNHSSVLCQMRSCGAMRVSEVVERRGWFTVRLIPCWMFISSEVAGWPGVQTDVLPVRWPPGGGVVASDRSFQLMMKDTRAKDRIFWL